ncbi:MAG: hypothetical protein NC396_08105 [Bacteroides sp.]|nr:hypothetical protein [Bacteroides sp.]MCM1086296.1 hypothetical protein [Bacteroides sp.]
MARDTDSMAVFDQAVSYQSELSNQEQIVITKEAEKYAKLKGNVYKALSYACTRGKLYFLSDYGDSCEQLYNRIIPEVEYELDMDSREYARKGHLKKENSGVANLEEVVRQWKILLVDCYSNKALNMMYRDQGDSSLQIYQSLLKRFEQDSLPLVNAKCYNGLGIVYANSKLYDMAKKYFDMALDQFVSVGDQRGIFGVCSNIVAFYSGQQLFEEALTYGLRSYSIAHDEKYNGQEQIYASLIMGAIYSGMKQYHTADFYYETAYLLAKEKRLSHLEGFCGMDYARNLLYMQKYEQARQVGENTLRLISGKQKYELQAQLLKVLSDVAEKQGDTKASLNYLRRYVQTKDSLNEIDNARQLIYAGVRYKQDRIKEEETRRENDFRIVSRRASARGVWVAVLSVLACLLAVLSGYLYLMCRRTKTQMQSLREETRLQVEEAERQVVNKSKELATNALRFLRLNTLQEAILKELKTLKTAFTLRGKEKAVVCDLEELAKQIASDKEWKDFQFYFEQVDGYFINKLSELYPEISDNEKHLCVLFKLGLTNRDVANLTGRTLQSVGMAKFRLKSKFNLSNSDELSGFLRRL